MLICTVSEWLWVRKVKTENDRMLAAVLVDLAHALVTDTTDMFLSGKVKKLILGQLDPVK